MSDAPLTFGLMLSNRGPVLGYSTPANLIDLGIAAERSGLFNTVWSGDAFLTNPRLDAVTLLAAVAARTEKVRLGPACMGSFTQRAALDLAYQWASLDQISGGRMVMVACAGGGSGEAWAREDRNTGVSSADRRALMWERIELLHRLFVEDEVTFQGRFHDYEKVTIVPKPLRRPSPIWAATNITRLASGGSSGTMPVKTLAKVGEICDGWMTHSVSPGTFAEAWGHIRASAVANGKNPDAMDNALVVNLCVRDDPAEALEETRDFLADYYGIRFTVERTRDWTAHGPAEACAASLRSFIGSGVKHIALRMTSRDQTGQFKRLTEDVLPLVNKV
jgi:alkanesulfonate monooxygenase SsuD/methylene tetrahydromethanopterin reductase-like flavin-dependent oxidoreductase (luciferase family)